MCCKTCSGDASSRHQFSVSLDFRHPGLPLTISSWTAFSDGRQTVPSGCSKTPPDFVQYRLGSLGPSDCSSSSALESPICQSPDSALGVSVPSHAFDALKWFHVLSTDTRAFGPPHSLFLSSWPAGRQFYSRSTAGNVEGYGLRCGTQVSSSGTWPRSLLCALSPSDGHQIWDWRAPIRELAFFVRKSPPWRAVDREATNAARFTRWCGEVVKYP